MQAGNKVRSPIRVKYRTPSVRPGLPLGNGFHVIGDRLFGFGDRGVLILEHIGPQPAVDNGLVWLEHIVAKTEAGVEEGLFPCWPRTGLAAVRASQRDRSPRAWS